ncbi:hypothetical protein [Allosphingosinicella flava]|uniref:hypothetical protein n=1 Tax=Allosphingosinicella flava TaxID=2771430 RepID=UPI00384C51A5
MKKIALSLVAVAALAACNNAETTNDTNAADAMTVNEAVTDVNAAATDALNAADTALTNAGESVDNAAEAVENAAEATTTNAQ